MKNSGNLTVTTPSDREIAMSRVLNAPRISSSTRTPGRSSCGAGSASSAAGRSGCARSISRWAASYRYLWSGPEGATLGIRGTFLEIARNERIVCTERFDPPFDQGEAIDTVTFVERAGKTTLTITVLAPSREVRDGMLKSGMADGVTASFDNLDGILTANG